MQPRPPLNTVVVLAFSHRSLEAWVVDHSPSSAHRFRVRAEGAPGPEFDSASFPRLGVSWRRAHPAVDAPVEVRFGGGGGGGGGGWLAASVAELLEPEPRVRVRLAGGDEEEFDSAGFGVVGAEMRFLESPAQRRAGEGERKFKGREVEGRKRKMRRVAGGGKRMVGDGSEGGAGVQDEDEVVAGSRVTGEGGGGDARGREVKGEDEVVAESFEAPGAVLEKGRDAGAVLNSGAGKGSDESEENGREMEVKGEDTSVVESCQARGAVLEKDRDTGADLDADKGAMADKTPVVRAETEVTLNGGKLEPDKDICAELRDAGFRGPRDGAVQTDNRSSSVGEVGEKGGTGREIAGGVDVDVLAPGDDSGVAGNDKGGKRRRGLRKRLSTPVYNEGDSVEESSDDESNRSGDASDAGDFDSGLDGDSGDEADKPGAANGVSSDKSAEGKVPAKKKSLATMDAILNEGDIPDAPGGPVNADSADAHCDASFAGRSALEVRIIKMLRLAKHEDTEEAEANHAMNLAKKWMAKYQLQELETSLNEAAATGGVAADLDTGLVKVRLRMRKSGGKVKLLQWIMDLAHVVANNFEVEFYFEVYANKKKPLSSRSDFTFYGLTQNARLAAYAYSIFFERIQVQAAMYNHPDASSVGWKPKDTRTARVSYCLGCTGRMRDSVRLALKKRANERFEKLARARKRAQRREAALNRGDERIPEACKPDSSSSGDGADGSDRSDESDGSDGEFVGDEGNRSRLSRAESALESARSKLAKLERQEANAKALVIQTANAPAKALENANVKTPKAVQRKYASKLNQNAFKQGHDDAADFDLNQQAIAN